MSAMSLLASRSVLSAWSWRGLMFLVVVQHGWCGDVRHFNPTVLGMEPTQAMTLLLDGPSTAEFPSSIRLDLEASKCVGATVIYPKSVGFSEIKRSLNQLYPGSEVGSFKEHKTMALWRVEPKKFAVQLADEGEELRVTYLLFRPGRDVLRNIGEAKKQPKQK